MKARLSFNLLEFPNVDMNRNGVVSYEELDVAIEAVVAAVKEHLLVGAPDPPTRILVERHEIVDDHVLQMDVSYDFAHLVEDLDVTSKLDALFGQMHQHFVTARIGGNVSRTVLDAGNRQAHFEGGRVTPQRMAIVIAALAGIVALAWLKRRR